MPPVRIAAAVALTRGTGPELEVLLVERNSQLRFFGGYWAFPGGVLEAEDQTHGADPGEALRVCASRELAEEIAVDVDPAVLRELGTITTPEFAPVRYQTLFLHGELSPGAVPRVDGDELVAARFWQPAAALEAWRRGDIPVVPPVLLMLELLTSGDTDRFVTDARAETEALGAGRLHPVYFSPGVFMAPLRTETKPPATTTNTVLVGEERVYVVDPATTDAQHRQLLVETMASWQSRGRRFDGVLLTHHHPDHIGAVEMIVEGFGLPLLAHPDALSRLPFTVAETRALTGGETLALGRAPDGSPDWQLHVHHTPGHAPGHLAFHESRYHALIAGDLCSGLSTVVIDPPEGHLATYLETLQRLLELPLGTVYPGHGPAHRDGGALLRQYIRHRGQREEKLLRVLGDAPRPVEELVVRVYDDTDARFHDLAARSLLAGLIKLEEEGRARSHAGGWSRT